MTMKSIGFDGCQGAAGCTAGAACTAAAAGAAAEGGAAVVAFGDGRGAGFAAGGAGVCAYPIPGAAAAPNRTAASPRIGA
jgi:hypothetical protein